MNFFYLDLEAFNCAKYLHDTHTRKMIVEYGQILSTVFWELEYKEKYPLSFLRDKDNKKENQYKYKLETGLYIPTHLNHPVVKWAMESYSNRKLIFNVLYYLSELYYLKTEKSHKTDSELIPYLTDLIHKDKIRGGELTVPPKCMPDKYKVGSDTFEDVILSYRNYYKAEKAKLGNFNEVPKFLK
jgi:hypothetical protein